MGARGWRRAGVLRVLMGVAVAAAGCLVFTAAPCANGAGWSVRVDPEPGSFSANSANDRYQMVVLNAGDQVSSGEVTLTDTLPAGITAVAEPEVNGGGGATGEGWACVVEEVDAATKVTCTLTSGPLAPGKYAATIDIEVSQPSESMSGVLKNMVTVQGGGLAAVTSVQETQIGEPLSFELSEFAYELGLAGGILESQVDAHPWQVTTAFAIPTSKAPVSNAPVRDLFEAARNIRSVAVELPVGFLGNPLATERCTETQLRHGQCPLHSEVGVFGLALMSGDKGEFSLSDDPNLTGCCSVVYSIEPAAGEADYPAEFGFDYAHTVSVLMYATVVHTGTGERVRVIVPAVPATKEATAATLTFFGEPGQINGSGSSEAFLSAPSDCSAEYEGPHHEGVWANVQNGEGGTAKGEASRIEIEPWGVPGEVKSRESAVYHGLTGCSGLVFNPGFSLAPSAPGEAGSAGGSSTADEPSAYSVSLTVPQTSKFAQFATPFLRNSTVKLPTGVSASPSAATGLEGCEAEGPGGINVGSSKIGAHGQDIGDPEATELGEGHAGPGGNNSPYDDGFYHTAKGHCPEASILGTVEVCTPLLPNRANSNGVKTEGENYCETNPGVSPLKGHIYLGEPECGGSGQEECSDAFAEGRGGPAGDGRLFKLYIEVEGAGVIVKVPGTVTANPVTGQLTSTFREAPQLAFGQLKLHFNGGPRAPIANPQTCGTFTTTTLLESWSHREANGTPGTPNATPQSSFEIGGCAATMAFSPAFMAGTTNPAAGTYSPFVLSFSRQDREQDFSGLTTTMPPGLVGKLAGIPLCKEPEANAGTCSSESEIGTTSALAGPGPEPFSVTGGHVYLTGPYGGGPFGLSIVVPTKAGPFNLGNEVVRAGIHINPNTAQVTVTTSPLPQSKDGIPFRLRTVNTDINRSDFTLNPTSCSPQSVTAAISAAQGATADVSAPFQATGCQNLPFKPKYEYSVSGKTSKANGASLVVNVSQTSGEANIAKVDLTIPTILPSRLTTIQKACLAATFEANPASCPEGSMIGTATAHTPLLANPLEGPAYLVSHGGAAFPDVEFVLQGEGIIIILDGKTDIKAGITYSRFETVPDSPVTSFQSVLPEGPHSALTTEKPGETNLCETTTTRTITVKKKVTKRVHGKLKKVIENTKKTVSTPQTITIPTTITGQNGATLTQNTKVTVTGCPTPKPAKPKTTTKPGKPKHKTTHT